MFFYKLLNFFTMTEFWDKPAEKSGKVLAAFLEGQPLLPDTGDWERKNRFRQQSTHRVAITTFWRTFFHHDGKINPAW
jgi:hypothetical protein